MEGITQPGIELDPVAQARAAVAHGAWADAYDLLSYADESQTLGPDALPLLADAAYMTSRPDRAIATWERAHTTALKNGDKAAAAFAALWVTILLFDTTKIGPLRGWFARLESLLSELDESPIHAGSGIVRAYWSLMRGELADGTRAADEALAISKRLNDRTFTALAKNVKARILLLQGSLEEGLALLDESAVSALSTDMPALGSGILYCSTICACQSIGEYERAEEWTAAMERWTAHSVHPRGFHGRCRVHRAQIETRRGEWDSAAENARVGAEELRTFAPLEEGWALSELGLIRLRMGDLDRAQQAFERADAAGWDPQPGMALVRLARGDLAGARASIRDALDVPAQNPSREVPPNTDLRRAPLLEAHSEIAAAAADVEGVRFAAAELNSIAERLDLPIMRAAARAADGRAALTGGDAAGAFQHFQSAAQIWHELGALYENARARVGIARSARQMGNEGRATREFRAAKQTFDRLGARLDARAVSVELGDEPVADVALASAVKTFLFTDIVRSTELLSAIGDEAWRHLLRWHDDTIRGLVQTHDGSIATSTGDGFLATFDSPKDALACAVAVQRALESHRRTHGFAPQVRIGFHVAKSIMGDQWTGAGVHMAARIAALAQGDEILASRQAAETAGGTLTRSEPEQVTLKGFAEPVEVVRISWAA